MSLFMGYLTSDSSAGASPSDSANRMCPVLRKSACLLWSAVGSPRLGRAGCTTGGCATAAGAESRAELLRMRVPSRCSQPGITGVS